MRASAVLAVVCAGATSSACRDASPGSPDAGGTSLPAQPRVSPGNPLATRALGPFRAFDAYLSPSVALARVGDAVRAFSGARPIVLDAIVPTRFDRPTRLATAPDAWLEITPVAVSSSTGGAAAEIERSALVYRAVAPATDAFVLVASDRLEEIRVLGSPSAETAFTWSLRTGPGLVALRTREGFVEALDREGRARLRMEPPFAVDANGTRRALSVALSQHGGDTAILRLTLDAAGLVHPIAVDPAWGATSAMAVPRSLHAAALLAGGKVLIAGGESAPGVFTSTAELFDPTTRSFTLAKPMAGARAAHGLVALASGKVMAVGGTVSWGPSGTNGLSTAELYDPATDTWSAGKPLPAGRAFAATLAAPSGKVAVIGGITGGIASDRAYVWDPATDAWTTSANTMAKALWAAPAAVLASGKILVAGGQIASIFDPATNVFTSVTPPADNHDWGTATLLADGRVAVAGGASFGGTWWNTSNAHEIYDPAADTWQHGTLPGTRAEHAAAAISATRLLVIGGASTLGAAGAVDTWVYDVPGKTWSAGPSLSRARSRHTATRLGDGSVLVAGGETSATWFATAAPTSTAEVYADLLPKGSKCGANGQCGSGVCADGHCCDRACAGSCESCGLAGSEGTCTFVTGATAPGKATCGGAPPCDGRCDGATPGCSFPTGECVAGTCSGGVETPQALCDGKGACASKPVVVCAPFACGAVTCKTTCASDADCVGGRVCELASGTCIDKKPRGATCGAASECTTGACADGVCCDVACDGACEACDVASSVGVCTKLDGVTDPECGTGPCAAACKAGACAFAPSTTACGASCVGSTLFTAGTCSGVDDTCAGASSSPCPGSYACEDATKCRTTCTLNADCASGFLCDVSGSCVAPADAGPSDASDDAVGPGDSATGDTGPVESGPLDTGLPVAEAGTKLPDTPAVSGDFQRCTKDVECATGHCVEGVCCDTACADRCHSCALLGSPGRCTPEPIGVDLKNECGPALTCLGTCDGSGQCIGAGNGTMCARNRCVGPSTGVGPAYCKAAGAPCDDDEAVPFDCMPYACDPAFGACLSTCRTSDDCARGFVCDVAAKACVPAPAAAADEAGCAVGSGARGGSGALPGIALLALSFGWIRRRRR